MKKLVLAVAVCLGLVGCAEAPAYAQSAVVVEPSAVEVVVPVAPPAPVVEVITVSPGPGYLWARGYWHWSGTRYFWMPGRYIVRVPGHYWVHAHYYARGRAWVHVRGHWR